MIFRVAIEYAIGTDAVAVKLAVIDVLILKISHLVVGNGDVQLMLIICL